jgi:hypothetical protein
MIMAPIVATVTIAPAMSTPAAMAAKDGQNLKPSKKATAQPVQAPVKGKGMATKMANAVSPKFS